MATLLYRLGRAAYRRAKLVIALWLVAAASIITLGLVAMAPTQDSFAIPGTESQDAIDRLDAVFPEISGASAQIVIQDPAGVRLDQDPAESAIASAVGEIGAIDGVGQALSPFDEFALFSLSDDGATGIIQLQFDDPVEAIGEELLEEIIAGAAALEAAGLRVEFGGLPFQDLEYGISIVEALGVLFAGVVLLVTFRAFIPAGMPLATALSGIAITMGGILILTRIDEVSSSTPLLALMIGLAVGIDYALFIVSRHRAQLADGFDPEESAATAVGTAGSSVVFAGVTVMIALLGLLVVGIPFLGEMGVAAAIAVFVAIGTATTMLPALFGLAGARLTPRSRREQARWRRRKPGTRSAAAEELAPAAERNAPEASNPVPPTRAERWVALITRRPVPVIVAVVGLLSVVAVPAFSLQLALPDGGSEPPGSTAREAYELISDEFGAGHNGPLVLALDITQTLDFIDDFPRIADEIRQLDGVAAVADGFPNPSLDTGIIQVIPTTGPADPATAELVERLRALAPGIEERYGMVAYVTGATAVAIDISTRLDAALVPFGLIVVGLSIVLLAIVFRSVLVPLKAALGFLLSLFAAFGVVVAVFQWGWGGPIIGAEPGPILSFMPILLIAIMFGLAMDYEVFLVSGMREEFVHGGDANRAIVRGFGLAAPVVTAAALIMVFVFGAFVPEGAGVIKVIALGLAVGIAVDAFLVRMTLVPAVMALLGARAWWVPAWLDRILPRADIEGTQLRGHRAARTWAAATTANTDAAIAAEQLEVGVGQADVGPVSFGVPRGAIAVISGDAVARRTLVAALAGRLDVRAGYAQVLGFPLPGEHESVARLVAIAEADAVRPGAATVGELLDERSRVAAPTAAESRPLAALVRANRAIRAVRGSGELALEDDVATLSSFDRAIVAFLVASIESAPVVAIDVGDGLQPGELRSLLKVVSRLREVDATVLLATPREARLPGSAAAETPLAVQVLAPSTVEKAKVET